MLYPLSYRGLAASWLARRILPERGEAPKLHAGPTDILMYAKLLQGIAPIDWIARWRRDFHSGTLRVLSD